MFKPYFTAKSTIPEIYEACLAARKSEMFGKLSEWCQDALSRDIIAPKARMAALTALYVLELDDAREGALDNPLLRFCDSWVGEQLEKPLEGKGTLSWRLGTAAALNRLEAVSNRIERETARYGNAGEAAKPASARRTGRSASDREADRQMRASMKGHNAQPPKAGGRR